MSTATFPESEIWNLQDIFPSDDAFARERSELSLVSRSLDRWRGRLGESAAVLLEALDEISAARKRLGALRCYATLRSDADTRVAAHRGMRQEIELLTTEISGRISYVSPELLALDRETLERFLRDEPQLAVHEFFLRDMIRQQDHVLSAAEERLLAETGLLTRSASSLYQVLSNVDLPRPEVTLPSGETLRMTPVEFHKQRSDPDRHVRKIVFPAYYDAYSAFLDTLAQNLYSGVKSNMFRARVRRYESCLCAALDGDNVPQAVYHNLIREVRAHLPLLHRYFGLRSRALGVERLEYSDLYCPLSNSKPSTYDPAAARELVLSSVAPVGAGYGSALASAFDGRWVDWHPSTGKRSGAYATGWAYDAHPYVLINFNGDFESVSTLTHEMGHAMHSYFSNRTQPFASAEYSIFVAEVASTLNEALLGRRMIEAAASDDEKLFLHATFLDGIRGTLFRQTMFAEFELEIHQRAEGGAALTGPLLNEIYLELLREYHGPGLQIDERYAVEWAAVPHFYYDFYVYQYSTGIVAAQALATALLDGTPGAAERFLEFLAAGGSDYPLELLRRAGVDLERAQPYASAFATVERSLDELESLLDSRESG